jgi:outer membrane protein OmpA-like peptidoglycan-associated protein
VKPAPAPAPVTPAPKPTPDFSAKVTDGDGTSKPGSGTTPSGATAVKVADNGVDVGCRMSGVELASCRVELYADVDEDDARRARTAATRRMLVGSGIVEADGKTNRLAVRIELNELGRALMRKSPAGLKVQVATTGLPTTGEPLKTTSRVQLVPQTARLLVGGYRPDQSTLPAQARRALRKLADSLAPGARIKVVGHTDSSARDDRYLRRLGLKRATTVVRYLRTRGVKATFVVRSVAATQPRAANGTKAGRARNRRVALTIVR